MIKKFVYIKHFYKHSTLYLYIYFFYFDTESIRILK